ncbi:unnamed protein product [Rotaria socialis]
MQISQRNEHQNSTKHITTILKLNNLDRIEQLNNYSCTVPLKVNDHDIDFQLDTGTFNTIIIINDWYKTGSPTIHPSQLQLKCYSGTRIKIKGECYVTVQYQNKNFQLLMILVNGKSEPLIGLKWINILQLDLNSLIHTRIPIEYHINKPGAAPIVPIKKPNGKIRIYGDFKVTVNSQILVDQHPIPSIDELLSRLNNGEKFTKFDLSHAYLQIELDEQSKSLVVINTPLGLFRYNRMPFDISNAPAIFQKIINQVIVGVSNSIAYLGDILITGKNEEEHLQTLEMVLKRGSTEPLSNFDRSRPPVKF